MALADGSLELFDDGLRGLRVAAREAVAFARQATLLHRDLAPECPVALSRGDDVVVVLHGLFATAGVLRPMREHIERAAGALTASFSYAPGPGVEALAERLADLVARVPAGARIHLVGHSLGGVVVRWFVQELGGDPRVVQTISMASPFAGTRHARFAPAGAGRDIVPGSPVLERLGGSLERASHLPHLSIVASDDTLVTGAAMLGTGDTLVVEECGHNGLLYHPEVFDEITRRVRGLRGSGSGA